MKSLKTNFPKFLMYFAFMLFAVGFTSCSNDDDEMTEDPQPTGSLTLQDQTISQNTLMIESVTVGQDSWIVVRNSGQENAPAIVSEPVFLEAGTHQNVEIPLTNTANLSGDTDGDDLVVMIHEDTGTLGTFDYNGQNGNDNPIRTSSGANMTETVNVRGPSLMANDNQMVTTEGDVTFSNVNTGATGGYIGLFGQNADGTPNYNDMVGMSQYIAPGAQTNVTARFNEGYNYTAGQTYYSRLFTDDPDDQQFTFTSSGGTEDLPETYGYDTTTGNGLFVGNTANTATPGGFTVGNTGTVTGNI